MRNSDRRLGFRLAMLLATAVLAAGCGSAGATPSAAGATQSAAAGTPAPSQKSITIGFVGYNATVPATEDLLKTAYQKMRDKGWTVVSADPQGDVQKANAACVNFVSQGVTAVVIAIYNDLQMGQCTAAVKAANIPYFYFSSTLGQSQGAINGILAGPENDLFIKKFSGQPDLRILALGLSAATPCNVRYLDFSAKWPAAGNSMSQVDFRDMDIKIGSLVDGRTKTEQWLTAHPAGSGGKLVIWACSGGGAVGSISALLAANRTDIPVYTWDFTAQEAAYVKAGYVAATAWPDSLKMPQALVDMLTKYFDTGTPQGEVEAPYVIITPETYDQFVSSHPEAVPSPTPKAS